MNRTGSNVRRTHQTWGAFLAAIATSGAFHALAQDRPPPDVGPASAPAGQKKGLVLNGEAALAGYTLFAPLNSTTTYLVDMKGEVAHSWPSQYSPGQSVYLMADGNLLRCAREPDNEHFAGGGIGGRVQKLAPDGQVLWEYVCADEKRCQHHDIEPLPSGNILLIAWEKKTREEALAAGRDPKTLEGEQLWPDCVLEIEPQGRSGGRIVWEWHVWDHLVQEFDKDKRNFGVVAEHPERIDLNARRGTPRPSPREDRRLRSLGYVGGGAEPPEDEDGPPGRDGPPDGDGPPPSRGPGGRGRGPGGMDMRADMCHTNAIAYHPKLDQILLSVHSFSEIWIIDHSTTTQEAAGRSGGRGGKGGDLLYRWGNPRNYGRGGESDQQLFAQHDARWIPEGLPGAGHILMFNNGAGRRDGRYSSVIEIAPPANADGRYELAADKAFGPERPVWEYTAPNKEDFFSGHISGAHRLKNGNTLICSGEEGRIFEVTADAKLAWDYISPFEGQRPPRDGRGPGARRGMDGDDRRPRPPRGPGGGPGRPGGPGGPGGLFRATRIAADDPGLGRLLAAKPTTKPS